MYSEPFREGTCCVWKEELLRREHLLCIQLALVFIQICGYLISGIKHHQTVRGSYRQEDQTM